MKLAQVKDFEADNESSGDGGAVAEVESPQIEPLPANTTDLAEAYFTTPTHAETI